jgi:diadenosine tetraphosphate (Ap4A) HIT family hydrolase
MESCVFCERAKSTEDFLSNEVGISFSDRHPISPGHTLVVPRRHEENFTTIKPPDQVRLWDLVNEVVQQLQESINPDGFNIGVNAGPAAGQTIAHAHIHVIPRFHGDVEDPRGGVRWVIPHHAQYWH